MIIFEFIYREFNRNNDQNFQAYNKVREENKLDSLKEDKIKLNF
jgi:hypothetical protein